MLLWLLGRTGESNLFFSCRLGFRYQQKCSLVNVKLKWAKDWELDTVVSGERDLKAVNFLISLIASAPRSCLPVYHLSRSRGQLGLPHDLKLSTFIRRYPNIFHEFYTPDSGGTPVPWFQLTPEAHGLQQEELNVLQQNHMDIQNRLCKLLMLTRDRILPLQTIDQLKWDLGLPYNYQELLILKSPELFSLIRLPDDRTGVKLLLWDDHLAVSELQKNAALLQKEEDLKDGILSFPVRFTRGFGLKKKCMRWLEEWQSLPYTSPYSDSSHLDPRTDVSEKRIVGVFHELLHLTVKKKTERKNVSNLRKPLSLPQKFTKVFERHPGIFYISKKSDTQNVILREAFEGKRLLYEHPIVQFREKLTSMMSKGFLDRSRGNYKSSVAGDLAEDAGAAISDDQQTSEQETEAFMFSDYDSDGTLDDPCWKKKGKSSQC